jgi:flagellar biosynthesis repressor protein FlbT
MPLSIPLPAGAKIIINGAVIENSGSANITLTVHNKANILRDKDVVTPSEADTPAKEIYHAVQNAYLFESNRDEWLGLSATLMAQFQLARPDAAPVIQHIQELIRDDKLYNALRACRRLIAFEAGRPAEPQAAAPKVEPAPRVSRPEKKQEIAAIKDKIAELEKRIAAIDEA